MKSKPPKKEYDAKELADRLKEYVDMKCNSRNQFARQVGVSAAQLFYMLSGESKFGIDKLLMVLNAYPELNPGWLVTGEGEMERRKDGDGIVVNPEDDQGIPLYGIEAAAPENEQFADDNIEGYLDIPDSPDCDIAMRVFGESMVPLLRSGDIVMAKELNDLTQISWGEVYLVVTNEIRTLKNVHPSEVDMKKFIRLVSVNSEYDPIEIERKKVKRLFHVRAFVRSLAF